jgi:hypothetical protein
VLFQPLTEKESYVSRTISRVIAVFATYSDRLFVIAASKLKSPRHFRRGDEQNVSPVSFSSLSRVFAGNDFVKVFLTQDTSYGVEHGNQYVNNLGMLTRCHPTRPCSSTNAVVGEYGGGGQGQNATNQLIPSDNTAPPSGSRTLTIPTVGMCPQVLKQRVSGWLFRNIQQDTTTVVHPVSATERAGRKGQCRAMGRSS